MSKLTIKHYLNTKLKGTEENNITLYPIYVQITYNRKTTNFASEYERKLSFDTNIDELKNSFVIGSIFKEEERVISDIILYESSLRSETFDLKELKNKYELYKKPIHAVLNNYLIPKVGNFMLEKSEFKPFNFIYKFNLKSELFLPPTPNFIDYLYSINKTLPQFIEVLNETEYNNQTSFSLLNKPKLSQEIFAYEAYCKFFNPNTHQNISSAPRLIDWINNKHKQNFISYLSNNELYKDNCASIIELFEKMIFDYNSILL